MRRRGDGVRRTRCLPRRLASLAALADPEVVRWRVELPLLASNHVQLLFMALFGTKMRLKNPASVSLSKIIAAKLSSLLAYSPLFSACEATKEATHHPAAAGGRLKKSGAQTKLSRAVRAPG